MEEDNINLEAVNSEQPKEENKNYVHKKVVANEFYIKSRDNLAVIYGMGVLTFLCAAAGGNWYSIVFGALCLGWGIVFLVKVMKWRKYLEETYNLKK